MMFRVTGVTEPRLDTGTMNELASSYSSLAGGLTEAHSQSIAAITHVLGSNDGPAADAFRTSEQGAGSIAQHLSDLAAAAQRTSTAYSAGAEAGGSASTAMQILARDRELMLWKASISGAPMSELTTIIQTTRFDLLKLQIHGEAGITRAFANLDLPPEHALAPGDSQGRLDEGIKERWAEIYAEDPEKAKEILQAIADEYADQNGIPRKKIQWVTLEGAYGQRDGRGNIQLDPEFLEDPEILLNTIVHEMEHSRQYEGMGFRWPWQSDKGGMSREERSRWRELNDDYVRNKGDDPDTEFNEGYWPRPIEVGARDAGRDFINNLTAEELERYL